MSLGAPSASTPELTPPATPGAGGDAATASNETPVSHPLERAWTLWAHYKHKGNYGVSMKRLGDFDTVEGFWRYFNNIPSPSQILLSDETTKKGLADTDIDGLSLFKKGIRPEWEDPKNMHGGELRVERLTTPPQVDQGWEDLLMGAVGEHLDPGNALCGVRVVDKSSKGKYVYRFEVWFECNDVQDKGMVEQFKENICTVLNSNNFRCVYKPHSEAIIGGPPTGGGGGERSGGHPRGSRR